jgi:DNA-binding LacI/PurR family transcriptional regulator/signal transduction histidine kinase
MQAAEEVLMATQKNSRPTIALFIHETFGTHYQFSILSGVVDATRYYDVNLISVCGSEFNTPRNHYRNANLIYQWVGKENVDGIIMVSPVFNYVDEEFQRRYCEALKPLPLRALGVIAGDAPNTVIDNTSGLRDVIRHLIEKHGYRRLAFVNGPLHNKDADERYGVYREVLAEYNIPFDPGLVSPGEFMYIDGEDALRRLWDEKKGEVDAIISGNDDMAFGILDGLRARGVKVPEQVAVTGFDDSDGASTSIPPLTTVRQPIYQQAYESVELLLAQIRGENVPDSLVFLTEPVYRRSCGCPSLVVQKTKTFGDAQAGESAASLQDLLSRKQHNILFGLRQATAGLVEPIVALGDMFMRAFMADLQPEEAGQPGETFLLALEDKLWETPVPNDRSLDWHSLISSMREQLLPVLRPYPATLFKAETLWQTAQVLVSERLHQKPTINPVRQETENNAFRWITQDLITTFEQDALMDVLADALPNLGIAECYVGIYEDIQNTAGAARLILNYKGGKRMELEKGGQQFPTPQALVNSLLAPDEPHTLVMESLHFRDECYGFLVFGLGDSVQQVNLNIGLRESVSGGLKGARLAREVQQHSAELESAYQTLRENQQQLMLAEKMASLGRLTAGIAHEMNTPLAAVRAVLIRLDELVKEYEASIGDASVTDEDHHEIARELRTAVQLADKAAERAAGFVRGVKAQTRGLSTQEHQAINAVVAVEDALLLLSHALMQGKCAVDFQKSGNDIRLFGVPGRLEQVVTNLINNAVEASYPNGGPITVCLNKMSDFVELQISDHGCGILPENLSKIFDPMFSTKPFGSSTGLGLTIVHDIVVGEFGGSIDVNSVAGQGATFTIRFPLMK